MADNSSFQIDLEETQDKSKRVRNVRIIHCGDGVLEECSEDEEERERKEEEERRKQEEMQKKLDLEAVSKNKKKEENSNFIDKKFNFRKI